MSHPFSKGIIACLKLQVKMYKSKKLQKGAEWHLAWRRQHLAMEMTKAQETLSVCCCYQQNQSGASCTFRGLPSPHMGLFQVTPHSKSNKLPEVLLYIGCQHHHYQPSLQGARTCALAFFNLASHFSDFQIPRSCFLIICHILHILYFCGLCKYFQHCKCKITTIKLTNLQEWVLVGVVITSKCTIHVKSMKHQLWSYSLQDISTKFVVISAVQLKVGRLVDLSKNDVPTKGTFPDGVA